MTQMASVQVNAAQPSVGVVGLGLLGRGIAACLLGHGFRVIACDREAASHDVARQHIAKALTQLTEHGSTSAAMQDWQQRYTDTTDMAVLADCGFVIESIHEDLNAKHEVFEQVEAVISPATPVGSNTSAIPISLLQQGRRHPQRFVGMHWGEPAHILRFLEIIRGEQTADAAFDATVKLAEALGKEPSLVQRDVRGFITNRLMYAMIREAFYLLETGVADAQTIDRSFRNDIGWWATLAGPFRWMDLTGISSYAAVMSELLPELCNSGEVPQTLQRMVDNGARGMDNGHGFYDYDADTAEHWRQTWMAFTWDIKALADKHTPVVASRKTHKSDQDS